MTDLTYCYLHMTYQDLLILDTYETPDYINGDLDDEDVDVPQHMKPPNPEDSEVLPSQVHPSYPYGNPTHIKHPAARPRLPHDRGSRAFFEDMAYAKAGVNGPLLWKDLALDVLLPTDQEKELQDRAKQARKMASGTTSQAPQGQQQQQGQGQGGAPGAGDQTIDEEDETDEDEDENDENENDDSSNEDDDEMDDDEEDDDDE